MWPDSPFAPARGSYVNPVQPPTVEPTTGPTQTVTISCAWLPFVRGALKQLLLQATWLTDVVDLDTTQQRVFNLIDLFQECGAVFPAACPFDFRGIDGQGWFSPASYYGNSGPVGHFVPLVGFVHDSGEVASAGPAWWTQCIVAKSYSTPVTVHEVTVRYDMAFGSDFAGELSAANNFGVELYNGGTLVASNYTPHATTPVGTDQVFSHDFGGTLADTIQVYSLAGVTGSSPSDGQVTVTQLQFTYTGVVPGGC